MAGGMFGGGTGTQNDPLLVEDFADLNAVRDDLEAWYEQTAHIDLVGFDWVPINAFENGGYDGGNFKISNLTVDGNHASISPSGNNLGLFGWVDTVVLKNIHLEDVTIVNGEWGCGSLAGQAEFVQVENCTATNVSIGTADGFNGGLLGFTYQVESMEDCHVRNVTITGEAESISYIGGLAGGLWSWEPEPYVRRCSATGTINMPHPYAHQIGGFAGQIDGDDWGLLVSECWADVDLTLAVDEENPTWTYIHGGFSGSHYSAAEVVNCYALGDVSGGAWSGGFMGDVDGRVYEPYIRDCFAAGHVTGTIVPDKEDQAGGLGGFIGGLVVVPSWDPSLEFTNQVGHCYFDLDTSGRPEAPNGEHGIGATTIELQEGVDGPPFEPQSRDLYLFHSTEPSQQRAITWPAEIEWAGGSEPAEFAPDTEHLVQLLHLAFPDKSEQWFAKAQEIDPE